MAISTRPIGILYEHPHWFKPLFQELEKRNLPFVRINIANHQYNPAEQEVPYSLLVNRVSNSAYLRGNKQGIFHSASYLAHVERLGIPVINGTHAQEIESSKSKQIELFASLGLSFPKTRIINHYNQILSAGLSLRFPIVIKPNLQNSNTSIQRYDSYDQLSKAIKLYQVELGIDHTALVQEFIPAKNNEVIRVETLNKKILYAIKIKTKKETYNLRPAEAANESDPFQQQGQRPKILIEPFQPEKSILEDVERIMKTGRLDTGAVEYIVSEQNDQVYYCNIIALSNFIPDAENLIGFNPYAKFVDYIEGRLRPIYEPELEELP